MALQYRAEIDGLRAIAVVAVILFHAEINLFDTPLALGGYVGVDIFFVISGYLISRIILSELALTGSFNFLNFYERRIRRILPALLLVLIVSLVAAWPILVESQYIELAQSALAALVFLSNYFFHFVTAGYGAESSLLKPMLHTWSLSIEEQFYLAFPLLIFLFYKLNKWLVPIAIAALFWVSFDYALETHRIDADRNFFMSISRFWELLIGAMAAYLELKGLRPKSSIVGLLGTFIGVVLIIYAIFFLSLEAGHIATPPNRETLIPTLGTAFVIYFCREDSVWARLLGMKPMVAVGLISYSLYLWHFPVLALARNMDWSLGAGEKLALIGLIAMLSTATYFIVEKPCRRKATWPLKRLLVSLTIASAVLICLATSTIYAQGWPGRFPKIIGFLNVQNKINDAHQYNDLKVQKSKIGFDDDKIKVLVVGNSHALDVFLAFYMNKKLYGEYDFMLGPINLSCFDPDNGDNKESADLFLSRPYYLQSDIVVVATKYFEEGRCRGVKHQYQKSNDLVGLKEFIRLSKKDKKKILIFGNSPEFDDINGKSVADHYIQEAIHDGSAQKVAAHKEMYDVFSAKLDHALYDQFRPEVLDLNMRVSAIAASFGVPYFDRVNVLCSSPRKECKALTPDGYPVFRDYGHFTLRGGAYFGQLMLEHGILQTLSATRNMN